MADRPLSGIAVGFVGLGLMGKPMARNLARAGADVLVHNRSPEPMAELAAEGMKARPDLAQLARETDRVIVMVSDTPAVEAVATVLLAHMAPGGLIIDMSTTKVAATRETAAKAEARGIAWVDAPVSGGQIGARDASLVVMAGGTDAAMARAKPILECLGKKIVHVGVSGAGQVAKAANQAIVGNTIGTVAEALTLARRAGVDPAKVREALLGGFAASRILEVHGQRMIEGNFAPGAKATTQLKDMNQIVELAAQLGIATPYAEMTRALYERLAAEGLGGLDHSGLIKVIDVDRDGD